MLKRILACLLLVCISSSSMACAEGLGSLFGGVFKDVGTIVGGLIADDADIPKEIHYGDYELFQQDIDAIERFFQEYAEFMKEYDVTDVSMLADYTSLMARYVEASRVLDSLDENKMTAKERKYYNTVLVRINKHLYSVLNIP